MQVQRGLRDGVEPSRRRLGLERRTVRAEDLAELLGVGLEEVGGGAVQRGGERRERCVGGVHAHPCAALPQRDDETHVLVHRQAGREGAGEHDAVPGAGDGQQQLLEGGDLGPVQGRTGLVELRGGLRGGEHGEVRAHAARDGARPVGEALDLEQLQQRILRRGGEDGGHGQPGAVHAQRDVDPLAAGLEAVGADAVHAAGDQGAAEVDGAVEGGVRGEGDDHAVSTSIPASSSSAASSAGRPSSVTRALIPAVVAKVTR